MITVLSLPGTFQPNGEPITQAFQDAFDPAEFSCVTVPYAAAYGDPVPYGDSREDGYQKLRTAAYAASGPLILSGYSQGAWGAGKLANEAGRGLHPDLDVRACALIADPLRPHNSQTLVGDDPGGYGISGERYITGLPVLWVTAIHDPISALPPGNPLRSIADLSVYWSLASPLAAAQWIASVFEAVIQHQLQPWWLPDHWRDWGGALEWAYYYTELGGRHTRAYVEEGLSAQLAVAVASAVTP